MITADQATAADFFHDDAAVDSDSGRCIIWRRTGATTWGIRPGTFFVPIANDASISGGITEMNAGLFHVEDDCPHGYRHGQHAPDPLLVLSPFTDGQLSDIPDDPRSLQNGQQEHVHRVLRRQLDEKLDEIAAALGLSDLQMMEVVAHWMQHKARQLRDAEVDQT